MSARRRSRRPAQPSTAPDDPILTQHQAFVRSLPCLSCGKLAPSECATIGMLARLGVSESNQYLVPLCGPLTIWQDCCHSRKHYLGAARFWSALGIEPIELAVQLWRVSGDVTAGRRAVMLARQPALRQRRICVDGKGRSPRFALDRGALRNRLRPTATAALPTISELPLLLESRS